MCVCVCVSGPLIQAAAQVWIPSPCWGAVRRDRPSCSGRMLHACHRACRVDSADVSSCQDRKQRRPPVPLLSAPNTLLSLALGRIYERVIDPPQMEITPGSGVWLGQHSHKHGLFKVTHTHTYTHCLSLHSLMSFTCRISW